LVGWVTAVLPKEICEQLDLKEGDFVEVGVEKSGVVIRPKKLVDPDELLTPEEEKLVRRGEMQLKRGESLQWKSVKRKLKL